MVGMRKRGCDDLFVRERHRRRCRSVGRPCALTEGELLGTRPGHGDSGPEQPDTHTGGEPVGHAHASNDRENKPPSRWRRVGTRCIELISRTHVRRIWHQARRRRLPGFQGPFPPPLAMSSRLLRCHREHTRVSKMRQLSDVKFLHCPNLHGAVNDWTVGFPL